MCSICNLRVEFSISHPLGLSVAVETRRAIEAGILPEPGEAGNAQAGVPLRTVAADALTAAKQRIEWTQPHDGLVALPNFFVLMVESGTWGFFHPTPDGFDPNCSPPPPNVTANDALERDAVLVSSDVAMSEIVAGRLPFQRALAERLVMLDADEARSDGLLKAWSKAYPTSRFSRLVCA